MDLIMTDASFHELGYLRKECQIDLQIGNYENDNDFEITIPYSRWNDKFNKHSYFFDEKGSEVGGYIKGITSKTASQEVILYGLTWRGLIKQQFIKPPSGQDYYEAREDANTFLRDVLDDYFDGIIVGSKELCGVNVNFNIRYINKLEAIEKTLSNAGLKINIRFDYVNHVAVVEAIEKNKTNKELSNDYGFDMTAKDIENGYNHVICLGKGELTERMVVELYLLKNGSITQDEALAIADGNSGINRNTTVYENTNAADENELIEGGTEKLTADEKRLSIDNVDQLGIGDVISSKERITGISMNKEIVSQVYKGYIDSISIENKVGD